MSRTKIPPAEAWARWRHVLGQAEQYGMHVEATGGEEPAFTPDFKRGLFDLREIPFPVDGACSDLMARAFRLHMQALIDVAIPARRVAAAAGVLGSVRALEGLWHAEQARLTQVQLTRHGAGD